MDASTRKRRFNGSFDVAFVGGVTLALVGLFSVIPRWRIRFLRGWGVLRPHHREDLSRDRLQ